VRRPLRITDRVGPLGQERILPEVDGEVVNQVQHARLHHADPHVEGQVWKEHVAREYLNLRSRCCLNIAVRHHPDSECADYVAIFERLPNHGLLRCDVEDLARSLGDPHIGVEGDRVAPRHRETTVPIQNRQFFQDVMGVSRIELLHTRDRVWVPSLLRLYRLDLVDVRLVETLQLCPVAVAEGFSGERLGMDDWKRKIFPSAGVVGRLAQTGDLPEDVIACGPEVSYDFTEVDGCEARQLGIDLIRELDLTKSIGVAIGLKSVSAGLDDRLTSLIERVHVVTGPNPARPTVIEGVIHRMALEGDGRDTETGAYAGDATQARKAVAFQSQRVGTSSVTSAYHGLAWRLERSAPCYERYPPNR
jgi:hypothetical protein